MPPPTVSDGDRNAKQPRPKSRAYSGISTRVKTNEMVAAPHQWQGRRRLKVAAALLGLHVGVYVVESR